MGSMWTLPAHSDEKIPAGTRTGVLSDKDSSLTQKIQVRLLAFLKDMAKQDVRRVRVMLPAAAQISAPLFHVTLRGVNFDHIVRLLATPFRTSDRVLYATYLLVEEVGRHRLCTCPARGCERLFVKVTQKQFCSTRCQSREYMREYRAKNFTAQKRVAKRGVSDGKQTRAGRR